MRRIAPILLLLAACSSPTSLAEKLQLGTDASAYLPGATVNATMMNWSGRAVFVAHCNFKPVLLLEKRVDGAWTEASSINGLCPAIYPSGDLRIDARGSLAESFTIEDAGEYRLTVYARWEWQDFGDVVVRSRPFTVRYPPD